MQDWVQFETNERRFKTDDFFFHLVGTVTLPRIKLDPVSAEIPGRHPIHFLPKLGTEETGIDLAYGGNAYRADIDRLSSALFNSRRPHRMILGFEHDRYYVVQVINLEDEPHLDIAGDVRVRIRLLRNYALRRWRDDEINPNNTEIDFSMPIVPVQTVHELTGSSAIIPYYNEGIDLPLALELEGVDKPVIIAGNTIAQYSRDIDGKLQIEFEHLKALENGMDRSGYLSGDVVEIPHGFQLIRLHYQRENPVTINAADDSYEAFSAGTTTNLQVGLLSDDLPVVRSITHVPPTFTRSSVGYNENGEEVANDEPRFHAGRDDQRGAILIEQAVTQELFDADLVSLTNWITSGIAQTGKYRGVAQIVRASAASGTQLVHLYQTVPTAEGETITAQVMARKIGLVDYCEMRLDFSDGSSVLSSVTKQIDGNLTNDFRLFSVTGTAPTGTTEVHCYMIYDGGTQRTNLEVEAVMPMVTKTDRTWGWHKSGTKEAETLSVPPSLLNATEGMINTWVYHDGFIPASARFLWETDADGLGLFLDSAGNYVVRVAGTNTASMAAPAVGWHMITVKWSGDQISMYLDGALQQTATAAAPVSFSGTMNLYVGADGATDQHWNGRIDDLRIFNKALADQDVADLYNAGPGENPDENTVFRMPMNGSVTAQSGGLFTSREHDISTTNKPLKAVLSFDQNNGGSLEFEARLYLNEQWGEWQPVAYDGRIQGIGPTTDLNGAKIQYRVRFVTYDISSFQELYRVSVAVVTEQSGKLTIKNRKRFA